MRWMTQGIALLWLLFLSFIALNDPVWRFGVTCDPDAGVFWGFMYLVWLTTLMLWIWNLMVTITKISVRPLWLISGIYMAVSITFIPKHFQWIELEKEIAQICN